MRVRYRYRFYPNAAQTVALARQFGCSHVVWNDALAACREASKAISGLELLRRLTQAKKTEERIWLNEVSDCALRQSVRQLSQAFQNFFNSCKGNGTRSALPQQAGASPGPKGRQVKLPRFKKKSNQQPATFTKTGFSLSGEEVYLAKIGIVQTIWSRPLPSAPSSVFEPFNHMPL